MEISYLIAPATVLILCIIELNRSQGASTLRKNGGYYSQIRIVSFDDQATPENDLLHGVEYITEVNIDLETLTNRLGYKYTYTKSACIEGGFDVLA